LDTGEDPACLDCGTLMMVAGHEVRDTKPDFITFRCKRCGRSKKYVCDQ
jgi:RNase P subunit RPR2